ncbi:MAG: [FeFe] hydrogenase H-cluster radical SAM maturase HydG [Myxococcota bacterium]|nr:[FeFe] hydrogenase H-cluster radical SAM maturase HydG [Myxococcota bacterium]
MAVQTPHRPQSRHLHLDESAIWQRLEQARRPLDEKQLLEILAKAESLEGLDRLETARLLNLTDPEQVQQVFASARKVKNRIYGRRLVVFAPLYISNHCSNECTYCGFRRGNQELHRTTLNVEQIKQETTALIAQGHKRLLLVAGESEGDQGLDNIIQAIDNIYAVKTSKGEIRRINVNISPLLPAQFERLKLHHIGTYQIFQETYHQETYQKVHLGGLKADFQWRLDTPERAMAAGIEDVGIGVLLGLFDWKFEVLGLLTHIAYLERTFGIGPHTISVPRLERAAGSRLSKAPPAPVTDDQFRLLVAVLRLAVPYTGIIMSTRETADIRTETFALGVSQISAGSRTNPGGYTHKTSSAPQFSLGDHRSLEEVVLDLVNHGYLPSFCTGCYRLGRTGTDFMGMARPGAIRNHCDPNGIATFMEYLLDFAAPETQRLGRACIENVLEEMAPGPRAAATSLVQQVIAGRRDVYC